jgi:hypothetical protein
LEHQLQDAEHQLQAEIAQYQQTEQGGPKLHKKPPNNPNNKLALSPPPLPLRKGEHNTPPKPRLRLPELQLLSTP